MPLRIQWSGTGEPILFFPGWNTTAAAVLSWLPPSFLERYRCGILEWPGLGISTEEQLPEFLGEFLDELAESLPERPIPVVGFCMGGIAAWAFAERHPGSVRCSVLVDSPLHFPLILTPLLVPGLGRAALRIAQGTQVGRFMVRRAILQAQTCYSKAFLDGLFGFDAKAALHYLRLFKRYGKAFGSTDRFHASARSCWRLTGENKIKVLDPCWGPRHLVQATIMPMEGAGHFPAVEAPAVFFDRIHGLLAGA